MKALLICPADRPAVAALAQSEPLALAPVLGRSLIEHWLEHLSVAGVKELTVLAADRPQQLRARVGNGARWGLRVEVVPEPHELSVAQARAKYRAGGAAGWLAAPEDVRVMDRLPGPGQPPLFDSYAAWFSAVVAWMPQAITPGRIGWREIQPGVWAGLHTRVSPEAELRAPCWLGRNVVVGPRARIGPRTVLDDRVWVEAEAEVAESAVGPDTLVGQAIELRQSLAWGSTLVNWHTGSCVQVPDAFLLCGLGPQPDRPRRYSRLGRLAALLVLAATWPAALAMILLARGRGHAGLRRREAIRPRPALAPGTAATLVYYELAARNCWWRRWPQLYNVVRGDFAWIGNRPLRPGQAALLANDFERLWLESPIGLISLADAEGCRRPFGDAARAHASYYAACANWRLDAAILVRALLGRTRLAPGGDGGEAMIKSFHLAGPPSAMTRPANREPAGARSQPLTSARPAIRLGNGS